MARHRDVEGQCYRLLTFLILLRLMIWVPSLLPPHRAVKRGNPISEATPVICSPLNLIWEGHDSGVLKPCQPRHLTQVPARQCCHPPIKHGRRSTSQGRLKDPTVHNGGLCLSFVTFAVSRPSIAGQGDACADTYLNETPPLPEYYFEAPSK